jgi:hypothetical protein
MSIITNITPNGDFDTQHGHLWSFIYTFDDGNSGVANHKAAQSPFQIGSEVDVVNKGTFDQMGNQRIAVKKPGSDGQFGGGQQQGGGYAQQQRTQAAFQGGGKNVHGATVGMALNNAVALTVAGITPITEGNKPGSHLKNLAYGLIQISESLESGWKPGQPAAPAPTPAPAAPAPQQQAPAPQPQTQQGGYATTQPTLPAVDDIEEEVPF